MARPSSLSGFEFSSVLFAKTERDGKISVNTPQQGEREGANTDYAAKEVNFEWNAKRSQSENIENQDIEDVRFLVAERFIQTGHGRHALFQVVCMDSKPPSFRIDDSGCLAWSFST